MIDVTGKRLFLIGVPDREKFKAAEVGLYEIGARYVLNPLEFFEGAEGVEDYNRKLFHVLTYQQSWDYLVLLDGWNHDTLQLLVHQVAGHCGIQACSLHDLNRKALYRFWGVGDAV